MQTATTYKNWQSLPAISLDKEDCISAPSFGEDESWEWDDPFFLSDRPCEFDCFNCPLQCQMSYDLGWN